MNRFSKSSLMVAFVLGLSLSFAQLYSCESCPCDVPRVQVSSVNGSTLSGQVSHNPWTNFAKQTLQIVAAQQTAMLINWSWTQLKTIVAGKEATKPDSCCSTKPVTEEERRAGVHLLLQTYNQKVAAGNKELDELRKHSELYVKNEQQDDAKHRLIVGREISACKTVLQDNIAKRDAYLATYEKLMASPATKQHNHKH